MNHAKGPDHKALVGRSPVGAIRGPALERGDLRGNHLKSGIAATTLTFKSLM